MREAAASSWLKDIDRIYASFNQVPLEDRLVHWKGRADQAVLLYGLLREVKLLRAALGSCRAKKRGSSRGQG